VEATSLTNRLDNLRAALADAGLDALLVNQPENRRYLSGFTGSAGTLIVTADAAVLATDFRYYSQARQQAPDFELAEVGYEFTKHLPDLLAEVGATRVGFERDHVTVATLDAWQAAASDVEWSGTSALVEDLRAVKSAAEIRTIRTAVELADQAFARVMEQLKPGLAERDVAWMVRAQLHELGADDVAFETIVACGLDSAKPHYRAADKPIRVNQPLVIDMGAVVDGYHSDMTRTIWLGSPDLRYAEIYSLVLEAQTAAEAGMQAGMSGPEVDALAREIIDAAGHGDHFRHGLGHGVGLAVHEGPQLGPTAGDEPLRPHMVATVEPGVYLPDWGGVRIEDMVVVTADGVEVLTQTPKALEAQIIPAS
jgi:Xaa-Pro aminopeptidase